MDVTVVAVTDVIVMGATVVNVIVVDVIVVDVTLVDVIADCIHEYVLFILKLTEKVRLFFIL